MTKKSILEGVNFFLVFFTRTDPIIFSFKGDWALHKSVCLKGVFDLSALHKVVLLQSGFMCADSMVAITLS